MDYFRLDKDLIINYNSPTSFKPDEIVNQNT